MIKYPVGKGVFVWKLKNLWDGDPIALANHAEELGLQWITVKVQDGIYTYQYSRLAAAFDALASVGIELWGWGYLYGGDSKGVSQAAWEAKTTLKMVDQFNLNGFFIDAETPYKRTGASTWATQYMQAVRASSPDLPLGLCSYRYPSVHPQFPWTEFLKYTDFHAPQVYWVDSHNPGDQLIRSYRELNGLASLPFSPVGSAYSAGDWKPTVNDLDEFNDTAYDNNMPSISWWRMGTIYELGLQDTIASHEWGDIPGPPHVPIEDWARAVDPWARTEGYEGPYPPEKDEGETVDSNGEVVAPGPTPS